MRKHLAFAGALAAAAALAGSASIGTAAGQEPAPGVFGFGTAPSGEELSAFFSSAPDGSGLPPGRGTAEAGEKVYAEVCVACHGEKLEGIPQEGIGGDKLIGGRGSLASGTPVKTIESYWPYSTTVFDYVKRAMPFHAPGSLTNDEVYSVVAYILTEANIIQPSEVMDKESLPRVRMPNRDGFVPDPRPEVELYR